MNHLSVTKSVNKFKEEHDRPPKTLSLNPFDWVRLLSDPEAKINAHFCDGDWIYLGMKVQEVLMQQSGTVIVS
jgi:hypothetical protein